jgi:hypothetical protein
MFATRSANQLTEFSLMYATSTFLNMLCYKVITHFMFPSQRFKFHHVNIISRLEAFVNCYLIF